jgi:repressor LexA
MLPLTSRQNRVLLFIQEFMQEEGFPPTRAEIAKGLGFRSVNAAEDHLKALVRKQAIEILPGTSRGIRLLGDLAEQHIQRHYQIDNRLFRPRAHYLLRVKGQSMRDAGILDGDLLAVHRQPSAENGEIVVARIDDEVTVKRFRRRGNTVRLMPENDDFSPVVVNLRRQSLVIEGIGVGVIRNNRRNL